jgi:hypothetical protein
MTFHIDLLRHFILDIKRRKSHLVLGSVRKGDRHLHDHRFSKVFGVLTRSQSNFFTASPVRRLLAMHVRIRSTSCSVIDWSTSLAQVGLTRRLLKFFWPASGAGRLLLGGRPASGEGLGS